MIVYCVCFVANSCKTWMQVKAIKLHQEGRLFKFDNQNECAKLEALQLEV